MWVFSVETRISRNVMNFNAENARPCDSFSITDDDNAATNAQSVVLSVCCHVPFSPKWVPNEHEK